MLIYDNIYIFYVNKTSDLAYYFCYIQTNADI